MPNANKDNSLTTAAKKAFTTPFGGLIEIAPEEGGPLWIDGRNTPKNLKSDPGPVSAKCTWRGAHEALLHILTSERALESGFISGRISISGDMSVMARLTLKGTR